jgi:hypothetical protein
VATFSDQTQLAKIEQHYLATCFRPVAMSQPHDGVVFAAPLPRRLRADLPFRDFALFAGDGVRGALRRDSLHVRQGAENAAMVASRG